MDRDKCCADVLIHLSKMRHKATKKFTVYSFRINPKTGNHLLTFVLPMKTPFFIFLKLFRESFLFAMDALRVNRLRTTLSLLGITIGIFAIILVFTVTDALEKNIRDGVKSLG